MQDGETMDEIRWDDWRAFLELARHGTLGGAAGVMGVNASTVHRRIAGLEATLGVALFERSNRGYALTQVGEALLPEATAVEEGVLTMRRVATGHDRAAVGTVVLTMPETLLEVIAPRLAAVRHLAPGLRPVLRAVDHMLSIGDEADLALRPSATPPEHAVGRKVGTIGWAVYSSAPDSGANAPWVVYGAGAGPRAAAAWRQRQFGDADILYEVTTVGAMHRVLRCTPAIGLLPCFVGDLDPTFSRVSTLVDEAATDLWLLTHADLRRSARVRAMKEVLLPILDEARPLLAGAMGVDMVGALGRV